MGPDPDGDWLRGGCLEQVRAEHTERGAVYADFNLRAIARFGVEGDGQLLEVRVGASSKRTGIGSPLADMGDQQRGPGDPGSQAGVILIVDFDGNGVGERAFRHSTAVTEDRNPEELHPVHWNCP